MLPDGWKKEKLKNVSVITTGNTPSPKNKEYYGGNIPFVSPSDLGIGKYVFKTNKYLSHKGAEVSRVVRAGSSLFTCIGSTVGKLSIAGKDVVTNQQINSVSPHDRLNDDFAFYYLDFISDEISLLAGKQALPIINKSTFSSITINLPPLPEQKKIAAILSTWDRAIEGTEKLLANSQQQKKALMQQLLTGKKRLPGFTGKWRTLKLKAFLQESVIPSPQPDPKKRITVRLSLNGVEKREVRGTESIDATNYFARKAGQFIYGKQNIHKGAFGIIPKNLDGFETSQDIPCFDFLPNVCPAWFFYYFSRENIHHTLETKMTGTGSKRLNQKTFLNLTCHAPPIPEQKAIAAVLSAADEEITALESDLSRLRQEKKALMQQLLTGKRRVTVD
ncbi:restriction endonuclease subunit S [Gluconobacter sp. LMG 31484]|uniref:Restriction endonuclease subunit S n=1 Tax=Gluconobacter vitians TaxID=2728102 RepID=A0ABR9Y8I7_9PROT|nr:restriction endonuclease subunit S [Gluconobacter vitians]MBF0860157.1 restriction endonuclease subunit S [Gluconobacter vitians]